MKSIDELLEIVKTAKRDCKVTVLANGCFDLLHLGHIRFLEAAKKLGGMLIVAINGDQSVRANKGKGRPFFNQNERAELVAALESVDHVCIFNESNARELLQRLKPDIQVKGSDYTIDMVPEADIMKSYGGVVRITGGPKDYSTSQLIEHIRRACGR